MLMTEFNRLSLFWIFSREYLMQCQESRAWVISCLEHFNPLNTDLLPNKLQIEVQTLEEAHTL